MPTRAEGKGIKTRPSKDDMELCQRICELEKQLKEKDKEIEPPKKESKKKG